MKLADNSIALEDVRKTFGDNLVVPGITAQIDGGKFTVILGPSGCGKSTLLNMIAGLERVTSGTIRIGAREVQELAPKERGCAMVFQNYALYPHMTVRNNIGYALKVAGVPKRERCERIKASAESVGLHGLLDRRPSELSGGQRQRVAVARAIVREPSVLLYDEPLSNLDAKLRQGMRMELTRLHERIGATSVFVTHDQVEAMTLADRIMLLNNGEIEQYAAPAEIYENPATTFVATFIGAPAMNLLNAEGNGSEIRLPNGTLLTTMPFRGPVTLGIRPESIEIVPDGIPCRNVYSEDLGSHSIIVAEVADGQKLHVATPLGCRMAPGETFSVRFVEDAARLFDPTSGKRIQST